MRFDQLTPRAQVHRLRRTALDALAQYPIEVARLRLLNHGFNTTFRVDTVDGQRLALRLNVNSHREPAWIDAEIAWLHALARDTDLHVPSPRPTRAGALRTSVFSDDLDRELPAVLFTWLSGPNLGDAVTPSQMRAVGVAMAALHTHADTWTPPSGTSLPLYDDALFGAPDHLTGAEHPDLSPARRAVIHDALTETTERFHEIYGSATPIPLHADLHQWNLKWHRGRLSVFDFDDSGLGVPMLDLATTAFYVRRVDRALEAALHEGYASVRALPAFTPAQYEAVLASRNLLLLNDQFVTVTDALGVGLADYIGITTTRLRHYLDTGEFRFSRPA
jgi:Ser/Thr protein kinase RdoA (MazF antagonist)